MWSKLAKIFWLQFNLPFLEGAEEAGVVEAQEVEAGEVEAQEVESAKAPALEEVTTRRKVTYLVYNIL